MVFTSRCLSLLDNRPDSRPITRTASLPTPSSPYPVHRKRQRAVTLTGDINVPEIHVSLVATDDSQPQLQESSVINHHPLLPSGDICCDGHTETEPPQSPLSVTSFSTNVDTMHNIPSHSLPSSTENLHSINDDVIPRPKPSVVDKSGRSSSWSGGHAKVHNLHITVSMSPSKSSETLPEAIEQRHHKPSCIPKKDSYTTSPSKLSDVSLIPVAERVSINSDGLMMRALNKEASDEDENKEVPPLSEVAVMNKSQAAESKIHRRIRSLNHNMSLSCHMHAFTLLSPSHTNTHRSSTYIHTSVFKTCFQIEEIG